MKALRFSFFLLIIANLALFVWNRGHFSSDDEGRETQRLAEQKAADKLRIVVDGAPSTPDSTKSAISPTATATDTPATPASAPVVTAATDAKPVATCQLLTGLKLADARQWVAANSAKLPELKLIVTPTGPASSFDILIPSLAGKEGADNKQKEIRALGINLPLRTIVDGPDKLALVFTSVNSESEAKDYLQALQEKGVRSARIVPRLSPAAPAQIEVRNLDAARAKSLKDLLASRNDIHTGDCPNR